MSSGRVSRRAAPGDRCSCRRVSVTPITGSGAARRRDGRARRTGARRWRSAAPSRRSCATSSRCGPGPRRRSPARRRGSWPRLGPAAARAGRRVRLGVDARGGARDGGQHRGDARRADRPRHRRAPLHAAPPEEPCAPDVPAAAGLQAREVAVVRTALDAATAAGCGHGAAGAPVGWHDVPGAQGAGPLWGNGSLLGFGPMRSWFESRQRSSTVVRPGPLRSR